MFRPENDRQAHCRRFHDVMHAGRERAADIGQRRRRIERREDADRIHDKQADGRRGVWRQLRQPRLRNALKKGFDRLEMFGHRLMRGNDGGEIRLAFEHVAQCRENAGFIRRPRASGDEQKCAAKRFRQARRRHALFPIQHAVEARITDDLNIRMRRIRGEKSPPVIVRDRENAVKAGVKRFVEGTRRGGCKAVRFRLNRRGNQELRHARGVGFPDEIRPQIILHVHDGRRAHDGQHAPHVGRRIERKVFSDDGSLPDWKCRTLPPFIAVYGRKGHGAFAAVAPKAFHHRLRLQKFSGAGDVKPNKRLRRVAPRQG